MANTYELDHFLTAQERMYPSALREMERGRKWGHWMWFIFPQHIELGSSYKSKLYGIHSIEYAQAYLAHCLLGGRLRTMVRATLLHTDRSARQLFNSEIDALKFQSSMTLFLISASLEEDRMLFQAALDLFYEGVTCDRTRELLNA